MLHGLSSGGTCLPETLHMPCGVARPLRLVLHGHRRHTPGALRCLHMRSLPSAAHPAQPAAARSAHSCPQYPNGQFELYNLDEDPHEVGRWGSGPMGCGSMPCACTSD